MVPRIILYLLFQSVCLTQVLAGFDLNAMPEEENYEEGATAQTTPAPSVAKPGRVSREQAAKLQAMYQKVLKLFAVLDMCDTDDFNLDAIDISNIAWSGKSKAMMVLNKVAKQGLIKKADTPRLNRILRNCQEIDTKISEIKESKMSISSQMSGVDYEEAERFREQLAQSPFASMRDNLYKRQESSITTTTTNRPVVISLAPQASQESVIASAPTETQDEQSPIHPLFHFL